MLEQFILSFTQMYLKILENSLWNANQVWIHIFFSCFHYQMKLYIIKRTASKIEA